MPVGSIWIDLSILVTSTGVNAGKNLVYDAPDTAELEFANSSRCVLFAIDLIWPIILVDEFTESPGLSCVKNAELDPTTVGDEVSAVIVPDRTEVEVALANGTTMTSFSCVVESVPLYGNVSGPGDARLIVIVPSAAHVNASL